MRVLVAYASRTGSTAAIADRIADVLRARGAVVDVSTVGSVESIAAYDAVVIGSAIRLRRWLREAMAFLLQHDKGLRAIPVAFFTVSLTGIHGSHLAQAEAEHTCHYPLYHFEGLSPVSFACFTGALDYSRLTPAEGATVRAFGVNEGDYRDWEAIERWAGELAEELRASERLAEPALR